MTGLRNSAATSRMIPIDSASRRLRCRGRRRADAEPSAMMGKEFPSRAEANIPIGEERISCQPGVGAGTSIVDRKRPRCCRAAQSYDACCTSKAAASLVEDDSCPAGNAGLSGDINSRDLQFAGFLDQQRRTTYAAGSRAIVSQQKAAARVQEAPDYAARGIRHQNQRMILLLAAEHDGAPNLRRFPNHRQDAVRRTERCVE